MFTAREKHTTAATKLIALAVMAMILIGSIFTIFPTTVSAAAAGPGTYRPSDTDGLNVRSGPSTGYSRIGGISYGTTFTVTQISNEWGYVPSYNGWVSLDYAQLVSSSSSAVTSANIPDGYYVMVSKLNNAKAVDIQGAYKDNGTCAMLYDRHSGDNQIFYFERLSDGTYRIKAKHSGRYLEVRNSSQANGADVAQWDWHSDYACKRWYIIDCGGGYYKLINKTGRIKQI